MGQLIKFVLSTALWILVLMVTGCAEITPYDRPNYREVPPGNGLLTGAEGEFVIYRKAEEPGIGSESGKTEEGL